VLSLALQDGDELRPGLEEPTPLADALEGTAKEGWSRAVAIGEVPVMVAR
jgi:hypothetical protein